MGLRNGKGHFRGNVSANLTVPDIPRTMDAFRARRTQIIARADASCRYRHCNKLLLCHIVEAVVSMLMCAEEMTSRAPSCGHVT